MCFFCNSICVRCFQLSVLTDAWNHLLLDRSCKGRHFLCEYFLHGVLRGNARSSVWVWGWFGAPDGSLLLLVRKLSPLSVTWEELCAVWVWGGRRFVPELTSYSFLVRVRRFITKPCPCYRGGPRLGIRSWICLDWSFCSELPGSASSKLVMLGFSVPASINSGFCVTTKQPIAYRTALGRICPSYPTLSQDSQRGDGGDVEAGKE